MYTYTYTSMCVYMLIRMHVQQPTCTCLTRAKTLSALVRLPVSVSLCSGHFFNFMHSPFHIRFHQRSRMSRGATAPCRTVSTVIEYYTHVHDPGWVAVGACNSCSSLFPLTFPKPCTSRKNPVHRPTPKYCLSVKKRSPGRRRKVLHAHRWYLQTPALSSPSAAAPIPSEQLSDPSHTYTYCSGR